MKICIVSQQIGKIFSGIGLYTYNLVNQLAACGHSVTLIAPATQRPAANLNYNFIGTGSGYPHNHARWFSQSVFFGMALKNLERHQTFDLIHFTEAREFFFCHG